MCSTHLRRGRQDSDTPFSLEDACVDVGLDSAGKVAMLDIRLLDPVALMRWPVVNGDSLLAGPYALPRAAAHPMVHAARNLAQREMKGAWIAPI